HLDAQPTQQTHGCHAHVGKERVGNAGDHQGYFHSKNPKLKEKRTPFMQFQLRPRAIARLLAAVVIYTQCRLYRTHGATDQKYSLNSVAPGCTTAGRGHNAISLELRNHQEDDAVKSRRIPVLAATVGLWLVQAFPALAWPPDAP